MLLRDMGLSGRMALEAHRLPSSQRGEGGPDRSKTTTLIDDLVKLS